jgi:hypothetical protein
VSLGELVDKLTILEIKVEKIEDKAKVELAQHEYDVLTKELEALEIGDRTKLIELRAQLKKINSELWVIEDDIRQKERDGEFDQQFIDLARSVYVTNDRRFEVKNLINIGYNSGIKEVKSYEDY